MITNYGDINFKLPQTDSSIQGLFSNLKRCSLNAHQLNWRSILIFNTIRRSPDYRTIILSKNIDVWLLKIYVFPNIIVSKK